MLLERESVAAGQEWTEVAAAAVAVVAQPWTRIVAVEAMMWMPELHQ